MQPIKLEIPKELFVPSEFHVYEEHADVGELVLGGIKFDFPDGVDWKAEITNTGGALLVRGTVSGQAATECARCLEQTKLDVEGEIEGYFLYSQDAILPDDVEDDEFERIGEDKTIDMAPLIQAALVLELPQVPLCDENCHGLCSHCGANLNEGTCACEKANLDEQQSGANNPFSVLKDFDFGE